MSQLFYSLISCIVLVGGFPWNHLMATDKPPVVTTMDHLKKRIGKSAIVRAYRSSHTEQHPSVPVFPLSDARKNESRREIPVRFSKNGPEFIIQSEDPIDCPERIEAEGAVVLIKLHGDPGTKNSYQRPWVVARRIKCL